MITREMIENLFERTRQLRTQGKATWDIDGVCRWSFFLADCSRAKLIDAGRQLEASGYEFVGLLSPGGDADQSTIFLRADRVEQHTVDSLLLRSDNLYAFAVRSGLEQYDGFDAGAVDGF